MSKAQGISLIETLVGLALTSLVGIVAFKTLNDFHALSDSLDVETSRRDMVRSLAGAVDCERTVAPFRDPATGAPRVGQALRLKRRDGRRLGGAAAVAPHPAAPGWPLESRWYAQAFWNGRSITVQVARLTADQSAFAPSPLDGRPLDFANPANALFESGASSLCPGRRSEGYLAKNEFFTSNQVLSYAGLAPPAGRRNVREMSRYPLALNLGCHTGCKRRGYAAGWAREYSDSYAIYNSDGSFAGEGMYADGQSAVYCGCVK